MLCDKDCRNLSLPLCQHCVNIPFLSIKKKKKEKHTQNTKRKTTTTESNRIQKWFKRITYSWRCAFTLFASRIHSQFILLFNLYFLFFFLLLFILQHQLISWYFSLKFVGKKQRNKNLYEHYRPRNHNIWVHVFLFFLYRITG